MAHVDTSATKHRITVKFPKQAPKEQVIKIHYKSLALGTAENQREARLLARHILNNIAEVSIAVVSVDDPATGLQHVFFKARTAELTEAIGCALFSKNKGHAMVPVDRSSRRLIKDTLNALAARLEEYAGKAAANDGR
jgi:hypothetical protein